MIKKFLKRLESFHYLILGIFLIIVFILNIKSDFKDIMRFDELSFRSIIKLSVRLLFLPTGLLIIFKNKLGWFLINFILFFQFIWIIFYLIDNGVRNNFPIQLLVLAIILSIYFFLNTQKNKKLYDISNRQKTISIIIISIVAFTITYWSYNEPNFFYKKSGNESIIHQEIKQMTKEKADSINKINNAR